MRPAGGNRNVVKTLVRTIMIMSAIKQMTAFGMLMRQSGRPKMGWLLTRSLVGPKVSFTNSSALNPPFRNRPTRRRILRSDGEISDAA